MLFRSLISLTSSSPSLLPTGFRPADAAVAGLLCPARHPRPSLGSAGAILHNRFIIGHCSPRRNRTVRGSSSRGWRLFFPRGRLSPRGFASRSPAGDRSMPRVSRSATDAGRTALAESPEIFYIYRPIQTRDTYEKDFIAVCRRPALDSAGAGTSSRGDRKSTRLNSSHYQQSRMPSSA